MKPDPSSPSRKRPRAVAAGNAKQKKQLALVAILLIVLLVTLVLTPADVTPADQRPDADVGASAQTTLISLKPLAERIGDDDSDEWTTRFTVAHGLPALTSTEITALDLFQPAAVEVDAAAPEQPSPRTETKPIVEYKLGAVYGAYEGDNRMALIDGKIVHTGENLENGVKVIAVSPEGVEVAP